MLEIMIKKLIEVEGGYSFHKADAGGETNFGVTKVVALENGYTGSIKDMTVDVAFQIYKNRYWIAPHYDKIATISPAIAHELFDTGVNCGTGFASKSLREALNLLNRGQVDYKDVKPEGAVDNDVIAALSAYLLKRGKKGEAVIVKLLEILQGHRYVTICKNKPQNESFMYGWIANRIGGSNGI